MAEFLKKNLGIVFLLLLIVFLVVIISPLNKYSKREIIIRSQNPIISLGQTSLASLSSSENKERVSLLFLGIPGKGYRGEKLTDTIIIINTSPKGEDPIGISIPRDLLIKFPEKDYYAKINSLYDSAKNKEEGIALIFKKLKEITDLDFDYFVVFDLEGVKNMVDQLDGIDVVVKQDIYDPLFPAPYDSYQVFSIKRGIHHLDGETTLKYIRSRNQAGGDFSRIQRQQEVINILKNKILSLNFLWDFPVILDVWKTIKSHAHTNIDVTDIKYAWNLAKKTNFSEIKFNTLDQEYLISEEIMLGNEKAYVLKPKAGIENYEEIKKHIKQLIDNL